MDFFVGQMCNTILQIGHFVLHLFLHTLTLVDCTIFFFKLRESHKCQWRASWANFWWMHTVFQALCWVYVEESLKTSKEIQHNTYSQTKETESIYSVLKCFSSKDFLWKHSSKNCINEDSSNNSNKMSNEKKIMTYGEQENVSGLGIAINETS